MKKSKAILFCLAVVMMIAMLIMTAAQMEVRASRVLSVTVFADGREEKISGWENDEGNIWIFLPAYADMGTAEISLNTEVPLFIDGCLLTDGASCGGFRVNMPYELTYSAWGRDYRYSIIFIQSGAVATMHIDTSSESMEYIHQEKGNSETGQIRLYAADGSLEYAGTAERIAGRGNSTWKDYNKKPYSLTLENEADLLGMGQAQRWVLLANAEDPSAMRNKIVYDFADEVGMAYSPDSCWVDLYLNHEYAGLYLLSEQNEVHPQRVDVRQQGSFLVSLEIGERMKTQEETHVTTKAGQTLRIHYPSDASEEMLAELQKIWQRVEDALLAEEDAEPDGIDVESWAKKYLIEEIFGNCDGGRVSQFFYYDAANGDGRIFAGPVWDYDNALREFSPWQYIPANGFTANQQYVMGQRQAPWFHALYQKETFYNRVVEMYRTEMLPKLSELIAFRIDEYVGQIAQAAAADRIRWGREESAAEAAEDIKTYLTQRIEFLSSVWIGNETYYHVRMDPRNGDNYAYYAVAQGESPMQMPDPDPKANEVFLGWYYEETDEMFDAEKPISEDVRIYAKWQPIKQEGISWHQTGNMIIIVVIAILFILIFAADIRRMRKGG